MATPGSVEDFADADTLNVAAPAVCRAPADPLLLEALRSAHARGARIASVCSGAFAIAESGLLDGLAATTHWMHAEVFRQRFPTVDLRVDRLHSSAGSIHTSAGTAAGMDLCIELVRQDFGAAAAAALARRIVTPPHRDGGQAQYVEEPSVTYVGPRIADVQEWALERIGDCVDVGDLAAHTHLSERQFRRRFHAAVGTTPGEWLGRERLRRAQRMLETTDLGIDQVAAGAGFASAAGLRAAFARRLDTSPAAYRALWAA